MANNLQISVPYVTDYRRKVGSYLFKTREWYFHLAYMPMDSLKSVTSYFTWNIFKKSESLAKIPQLRYIKFCTYVKVQCVSSSAFMKHCTTTYERVRCKAIFVRRFDKTSCVVELFASKKDIESHVFPQTNLHHIISDASRSQKL